MARTKPMSFLIFGAAAIVALLAALMAYKKIQSTVKRPVEAPQNIRRIAVAGRDLAGGTKLAKEDIKVAPFLEKSLPVGCFFDVSTLEGRVLIFPVNADEPIFESRLAPITLKTGGIAAVVSSKKRAMALRVNEVTGMSGLIHPGNRVDVLVTVTKAEEKEGNPIAKTVLENILVLATGVELTTNAEKPIPVNVITVEVTPEEAEKIALAITQGTIHVALRNFADSGDAMTGGTTVPDLLSSYGGVRNVSAIAIEKNKEASAQIYTVMLIKGSDVTILRF